MSAYAYQPSQTSQTGTTGGANNAAGGGNLSASATAVDDRARAVEYTCGDCDAPVALKRGEPIRCRSCGHRVLYKQRTNRMVQFEAR